MLDAQVVRLTKIGTVTVTPTGVVVEGFRAVNGTCRDVAALAAQWAIGELNRELMRTMERPGGGSISVGAGD